MATVDVKSIVKKETTPTEDGQRLAEHILTAKVGLEKLTLDVSGLAPEDLVSSFVNAFLHALENANVDVRSALKISWKTRFKSEAQRLDQLVRLYVEAIGTAVAN